MSKILDRANSRYCALQPRKALPSPGRRPTFASQMHPYSEQIIRHRALTDEGKPCEILERITYEKRSGVPEPVEINRRFDLTTGERLNKISDSEFDDDISGARLRLRR